MLADSTVTKLNMTPFKKYIVFAIIAVVTMAGIYAYKEYNRKAADLTTATPQEIISATDLLTAFTNDEIVATKKFSGKTVLVTGNVAEIINQQDTMLNVFLGNETALNKVSCLMDMSRREGLKNIAVGKRISIKGICIGFLADVEMNHCVIVNEK